MAGKVQGCQVGAVYPRSLWFRNEAAECAKQLTEETKKPHTYKCWTENISDGLPPVVIAAYCKVIRGEKR